MPKIKQIPGEKHRVPPLIELHPREAGKGPMVPGTSLAGGQAAGCSAPIRPSLCPGAGREQGLHFAERVGDEFRKLRPRLLPSGCRQAGVAKVTSQQNARGFYRRAWPAADPPTSGSAPRARAAAVGPEGALRPKGPRESGGGAYFVSPSRAGRCSGDVKLGPRASLSAARAARQVCVTAGGGEQGGREARFSPAALTRPGSAETQASSARARQGSPGQGRAHAQWDRASGARGRRRRRRGHAPWLGVRGRGLRDDFLVRVEAPHFGARGARAGGASSLPSQRRAPRGDGGAASETHGGRGRGCVLAEAWSLLAGSSPESDTRCGNGVPDPHSPPAPGLAFLDPGGLNGWLGSSHVQYPEVMTSGSERARRCQASTRQLYSLLLPA